MLTPLDFSLDLFVRKLEAGIPFAFSRWGDGEWRAILGESGQNCDGHAYTGALRNDLSTVLKSRPDYLLGMQPFAVRQLGGRIEGWLERRHLHLNWIDADVFHRASIDGRLEPLLEALPPVLLVGPAYLERINIIPVVSHLVVPDRNCYESYTDIFIQARTMLAKAKTRVVAISAGMMSNILIHHLHANFPNATLIDFGSLWDPYAGKATRAYHRKILADLTCS